MVLIVAAYYIAALDYGSKRVGVALTSSIAKLPAPLTTLANNDSLLQNLAELIRRESVKLVVVGLPRNMDGTYSDQTRAAEAFAAELRQTISVPVELADETLTSVDAEATLAGKRYDKGEVDALAAAYILQRYLADNTIPEDMP